MRPEDERARASQVAPGRGPAGGPAVSSLARWAPRANRVPTGSERRRDGGLSRSDFLPAVGGGYAVACCTRGVAQFGSSLRSGRRGRGFKSRHPDDEDVRELARETSEEEGVERPKGLSTPTLRRPAMSWAFCRMRVDTPTTHSPSVPAFARPSRLPPHVAGVRSRGFSLRSHAHARTARRSGVLHGGRGFVQCAQPTASSSRPSGSGSPGRGRRPNALP